MGKIFPGLDLVFRILRVRSSGLQRYDYSLLMARREAGHMLYFSFEEAKHRGFHDIRQLVS